MSLIQSKIASTMEDIKKLPGATDIPQLANALNNLQHALNNLNAWVNMQVKAVAKSVAHETPKPVVLKAAPAPQPSASTGDTFVGGAAPEPKVVEPAAAPKATAPKKTTRGK